MSFCFTIVIFLCIAATAAGSDFQQQRLQCQPWEEAQEQQKTKLDVRSTAAAPKTPSTHSCAKPVSLFHEGQFSSGIATSASPLLPPWFNGTSFRLGQKFAAKNIMGMVIGTTYALSIFSAVPDVSSVVFHTHQSNSPAGANRRHLVNTLHFKLWLEDVAVVEDRPEELSSRFIKSLTKVREVHSKAAARFKHKIPVNVPRSSNVTHNVDKRLWAALATDLKNSKIPAKYRNFPREMSLGPKSHDVLAMNNLGMGLIQWALIGPQFMAPEACGVWRATDEEWSHFFHFWAVLGYAMGIDDEYNVALQPDLDTTRAYFQEIYDKYFIPSMFNFERDEESQILWECFFEGTLNLLVGPSAPLYFKKDQVMIWALETFMRVPATAIRANLKLSSSRGRVPLSTGFERLVPLLQFDPMRKLGIWGLNNLYLRPDAKRVFGIDSNDLEQIVEHAYT